MRALALFLAVALFSIVVGCGGDPSAGPLGIATIKGFVTLQDDRGLRLADHSGVTITLEGTDRSVTTATDGSWTMENVPSGTYDVTIAKPGFGTYKDIGYKVVGSGVDYFPERTIVRLPTFTVTSLEHRTIIDSSDHVVPPGDTLTIRFLPALTASISRAPIDGRALLAYVFIGTKPTVSSSPDHHSHAFIMGFQGTSTTASLEHVIDVESYPAGTVLYAVAYPSAAPYEIIQGHESWNVDWKSYYDPRVRGDVVTTLAPAPSNVVSFTIP